MYTTHTFTRRLTIHIHVVGKDITLRFDKTFEQMEEFHGEAIIVASCCNSFALISVICFEDPPVEANPVALDSILQFNSSNSIPSFSSPFSTIALLALAACW